MIKTIYLAGGCFWGTEHLFKQVQGVVETCVGYANGHTDHPTYQDVCTDTTGYAETVMVKYDDQIVDLASLIELYFMAIDPTSVNKQGEDEGTQYRTGIYYVDPAQLPVINARVDAVQQHCGVPLAVEVEPLRVFYAAELYHQDYLDKNPGGYCHLSPGLFEFARRIRKH